VVDRELRDARKIPINANYQNFSNYALQILLL
jgi:hypothetical protein